MKIRKETLERTIYIILLLNIILSLILSSIIVSFRGSGRNLLFFFENDKEFVLATLLAFVVLYPISFLIIYLATFIVQLLMRDKEDGPAGN